MSLDPEPIAVTLRVADAFEQLGIEYLVGGSVASSVHGRPRTTQDVDIVARISGRHVTGLVSQLEKEFYIDADMIHEAIAKLASFNIMHLETMLKVDVFVFAGDELGREEMRRRVPVMLRNACIWFASAEDIVIHKLQWYRKGGGVSERQWRDVVGVLEVQGARFDAEYARLWAQRLGATELLERAFDEAAASSAM